MSDNTSPCGSVSNTDIFYGVVAVMAVLIVFASLVN